MIWHSVPLHAQITPDLFPEDLSTEGDLTRTFCQPGVLGKSRSKGLEVVYGNRGSGYYNGENFELTDRPSNYRRWESLKISLKVPIIIKDELKILIGYKYYGEYFNFDRIGNDFSTVINGLNTSPLKSNNFSVIVSRSLDERRYLAVRFRYGLNGNYKGFLKNDQRYAAYNLLGIYGIKPNENFEWGVGLTFSKNFRRFIVLPLVVVNKNFNEKWGMELVLPGLAYMRYNASEKDILLGGLEFNSKNFRLDIAEPSLPNLDYAYNQSHILSSIRYQRQLFPWVWASIQAGYLFNFSTRFEAKNSNTTAFELTPSNDLFFKIGIFISPESSTKK